jgi:hypothetical protein
MLYRRSERGDRLECDGRESKMARWRRSRDWEAITFSFSSRTSKKKSRHINTGSSYKKGANKPGEEIPISYVK